MTENTDLRGGGLIRIHRVITRALKIALEKTKTYQHKGLPEDTLREGYVMYLRSLVQTLRAHHAGEDEVVFPFLQQKEIQGQFNELVMDHRTFTSFLLEVDGMINAVAEGDESVLDPMENLLSQINAIWHPHIAKEEMDLLASALQKMSLEEEQELNGLVAKYTQEHGGPPEIMIPFTLFNLALEDRETFAEELPNEVISLVNGPWKEKWGVMVPFFLG